MPESSVLPTAIYQLRVVLCGVSPLVWRRLLVASDTSIAELGLPWAAKSFASSRGHHPPQDLYGALRGYSEQMPIA